jgi:hypothetical protein
MKRNPVFVLLISSLLALGLLVGLVKPAAAGSPGKLARYAGPVQATKITLRQPGVQRLGKSFFLAGSIRLLTDQPLANKSIDFYLDGDYLGQARSDRLGLFDLVVSKDLPAGAYTIVASYDGGRLLAPSEATTLLKVRPTQVQVQTIPPTAGITFRMDGRRFQSGPDGIAKAEIMSVGQYRLEVLIDEFQDPSVRIEFGRWQAEDYQPFRDISIPGDETVQVGLDVFHQVRQTFVDLSGYPVDSGRITSLTLKSIQGDVFTFTDGQPRWLPASRTTRRVTGLEETKLQYSVMKVMVDGSNVVNQAQQRFFTSPGQTWPISLLLYSLNVSATDGLFGSPVGKSVNLYYPDGQVVNYPLDGTGKTAIHSLARGIYRVELVGASGISSAAPVALSRDQVLQTKVITYLDLAVVGLLGLTIVLGLFFYGRPWILGLLSHRLGLKKGPLQEVDWATGHEN